MYCPNPECPSLLEHGLPAEFRDDVYECAECGHALEYGEPSSAPESLDSEPVGWVRVAVYDSGATAHAAKGLLEDEGIEALLTNEHFSGTTGFPAAALGGVDLLVPADEAERALVLIESVSAPLAEELPLDDPYEQEGEAFTGSAEASETSRLLQLLAVLLFAAALYFLLRDVVEL